MSFIKKEKGYIIYNIETCKYFAGAVWVEDIHGAQIYTSKAEVRKQRRYFSTGNTVNLSSLIVRKVSIKVKKDFNLSLF